MGKRPLPHTTLNPPSFPDARSALHALTTVKDVLRDVKTEAGGDGRDGRQQTWRRVPVVPHVQRSARTGRAGGRRAKQFVISCDSAPHVAPVRCLREGERTVSHASALWVGWERRSREAQG